MVSLNNAASPVKPSVKYFEYWPASLTPAESSLRQQLEAIVTLPAMLYIYTLHRGMLFEAAPLPAAVKRREHGMCYRNAAELAIAYPEDYAYVEGYAQSVLAVQHAWCVTKDGRVVDPTWKNPSECAYYGIPINVELVKRRALETGVWSLFAEMPRREVLATPIQEMAHPWWKAELASRPKWEELEAVLTC